MQTSRASGRTTKILLHIALIALLGVLSYSNTLDSPFTLDDGVMILENPIIKNISYVTDPFSASEHKEFGLFWRRFMGFASFALSYSMNGLDVRGYHIFNISLHVLNAILVYLLAVLALKTPMLSVTSPAKNAGTVALLAGLLFVAHPIQTEAVTYIYQRMAALVAFFYISSVVCYLGFRLKLRQGRQLPAALLYVLCLASAVLAVKTKENSLTLPLVIVVTEWLFFEGPKRRRALYVLPIFLSLFLYPIALLQTGLSLKTVLIGSDIEITELASRGAFESDYLNPSERRWEYLFTEFRVVPTYLRLLLLPINQNFDYDYPVFASPFHPQVVTSLLLIIALLIIAAFCLQFSRNGKGEFRLVMFGLLWFFIAISVESSIIPLPKPIAEYRLYLPSAGAFICLASLAIGLLDRLKPGRLYSEFGAFILLIPLLLSAATYTRNSVWHSNLGLWEDAVKKSPGSSRVHNNLALSYMGLGMNAKAVEHYLIALRIEPSFAGGHNNLANAYRSMGMDSEAMEHYEKAIRLDSEFAPAYANMGLLYKRSGRLAEAVESFEHAASLDPESADIHYNLANTMMLEGLLDKAIEHYEKALSLRPDNADARRNLAVAYSAKGIDHKVDEFMAPTTSTKGQ